MFINSNKNSNPKLGFLKKSQKTQRKSQQKMYIIFSFTAVLFLKTYKANL